MESTTGDSKTASNDTEAKYCVEKLVNTLKPTYGRGIVVSSVEISMDALRQPNHHLRFADVGLDTQSGGIFVNHNVQRIL